MLASWISNVNNTRFFRGVTEKMSISLLFTIYEKLAGFTYHHFISKQMPKKKSTHFVAQFNIITLLHGAI